jgi:hypothetical protein
VNFDLPPEIGHGTAEIHRWMIARDLLGPAALGAEGR